MLVVVLLGTLLPPLLLHRRAERGDERPFRGYSTRLDWLQAGSSLAQTVVVPFKL
jgi:hypothetical protein